MTATAQIAGLLGLGGPSRRLRRLVGETERETAQERRLAAGSVQAAAQATALAAMLERAALHLNPLLSRHHLEFLQPRPVDPPAWHFQSRADGPDLAVASRIWAIDLQHGGGEVLEWLSFTVLAAGGGAGCGPALLVDHNGADGSASWLYGDRPDAAGLRAIVEKHMALCFRAGVRASQVPTSQVPTSQVQASQVRV